MLFGYDIISTLAIWQRAKYAGVAELADALASGASDRKVVWVQVPSPAPKTSRRNTACFFIVDMFKNAVAELQKTAVAELHQVFDLVEAELVPQHEISDLVEAELVPQTESASFRC